MVGEQIDFIDIQHPAVGLGQHPRGELRLALPQCSIEVEGADQAFFGCAQRQGDKLTAGEQIG